MDGKIQLLLAATAHHEFGVGADVFRAFGALLAANDGLVTHPTQHHTDGDAKICFQDIDDRIHAGTALGQVLQNRHRGEEEKLRWERG